MGRRGDAHGLEQGTDSKLAGTAFQVIHAIAARVEGADDDVIVHHSYTIPRPRLARKTSASVSGSTSGTGQMLRGGVLAEACQWRRPTPNDRVFWMGSNWHGEMLYR